MKPHTGLHAGWHMQTYISISGEISIAAAVNSSAFDSVFIVLWKPPCEPGKV